jgi:hypothetical protein
MSPVLQRPCAELGRSAFAFSDPPYIENGDGLYLNEYTLEDHRALATKIQELTAPWLVTYDAAAVPAGLYSGAGGSFTTSGIGRGRAMKAERSGSYQTPSLCRTSGRDADRLVCRIRRTETAIWEAHQSASTADESNGRDLTEPCASGDW